MEMQSYTEEYYRRRYEEYKNDSFINWCISIMEDIIKKSPPPIIIVSQYGTTECDLDLRTKEQLRFWQEQLDNHITKNYADIIHP